MKRVKTGYLRKSFVSSIDDSEQPYALWVPTTYNPGKKYPLMVALHGTDADEKMIPEECFDIPNRGFREDVILLSPLCRGDLFYRGAAEADLWEAIKSVKADYKIDPSRHYLTGLSMGGYAAWRLGALYPSYWAAIAPVCGGGREWMVPKLRSLPIWCVHGDEDPSVPVDSSRQMIRGLEPTHSNLRYDELSDWGHNSWDWLYDRDRERDTLVDWFLSHRKREAARNVFVPRRQNDLWDLFGRRLIVSFATGGSSRESKENQTIARQFGQFHFGDWQMRVGEFPVRADKSLTAVELQTTNHLFVGKPGHHSALKTQDRWLDLRCMLAKTTGRKPALQMVTGVSDDRPNQTIGICQYKPGLNLQSTMETILNETGGETKNLLVP